MKHYHGREYSLNATLNIDLLEKLFGKKMEILFQKIYYTMPGTFRQLRYSAIMKSLQKR